MKKKYVTPEMEITVFEEEDMIVTSTGITGNPGAAGGKEPSGDLGDLFP